MTARRRPRSDLFRVCVRLLVTIVVVLLVLATGTLAPGDGPSMRRRPSFRSICSAGRSPPP
ncbi:hypothetical protein, partial [Rathayibacter sp. AY1E1]|uniref:hypothetical protein n=1 Tax=Rathayibacter sp. AY1E1 TaxID=2080549 RepID=UPI001CA5A77D